MLGSRLNDGLSIRLGRFASELFRLRKSKFDSRDAFVGLV